MTLTYPSFDNLEDARLAAIRELLVAVISAYNPLLDLRRGVIGDLVLQSRALLATASDQAIANELDATSLTKILLDPTIASDEAVDRLLGNFRITRRAANKAVGQVAITLDRLSQTIIPVGSSFVINGQTFTADKTYFGRVSSGEVVLPTDRLISPVTGNNFMFVIDVIASVANAAGNVRYGASAVPSFTPLGFVRAYAYEDFAGGTDAETNTSVVNRLTSGPAARAWSNRPSIEATIREQAQFQTLINTSIVGHGDPEMLRSQHALWPVAAGGRSDLYARTALLYTRKTISKTATLASKVGALGTWQFGMTKEDAPGFYDIVSVTLPSGDPETDTFVISQDTRSADVSGDSPPDIVAAAEAVYSPFQASVIQFADTITDATSLTINVSQATYTVVVRVMPDLAELQEFWSDAANAPTSGDVLIKAPVPCFLSLTMTLTVPVGTTLDEEDIKQAMSNDINGLDFPGVLSVSYVSSLMHSLVPSLTMMTVYSFSGTVRKPGGTNVVLTGSGDLTLPDLPEEMVTAKTTVFFLETTDIDLTIVQA